MIKCIYLLHNVLTYGLLEVPNPMTDLSSMSKEYNLSHLEESDLDPNPFKQFDLWLEDAIASEIPEPHAMSLATVDKKGIVSVRMMICKAIDEEGFKFVTHYNSHKGQSLLDHPQAAIQFWWPALERQVRIEGITEKLSSKESDEHFSQRDYESQLGVFASQQSQIMRNKQTFLDEYESLKNQFPPEDALKRPDYWGGFILKPTQFEFWQGGLHRLHDRLCYQRSDPNAWKIVRLYP